VDNHQLNGSARKEKDANNQNHTPNADIADLNIVNAVLSENMINIGRSASDRIARG
jgi:hypothetical protein